MLAKKFGILSVLFLLLIFSPQFVFAGVTGKIAGTVTDKESGEPLQGANVIIKGTLLGAASDYQGNFTILNVPPGVYNLTVSVIGYTIVNVTEVQVLIDQTARVDFQLIREAIQGETITVVAERDIIKPDVSTSVVAISADEIENLPVTTVGELVGLQAGVGSGLVIRGGGSDEALLLMDGATLRDPRNNQPISTVAFSAIKEISLERGGFSAEYGNVRSGIVNIVTREGSRTGYSGAITVKYSSPAAKHFGVSPFDKNSMWLKPYLNDEVCWVGTQNGTWNEYTQRQYPQFDGWNTISERLLSDEIAGNDLTPQGAQQLFLWEHRRQPKTNQPDYNIDAGFGGPVPIIGKQLGNLRFFSSYRQKREMLLIPLSRDDYLDYDWTIQATADISQSVKLKLSGLTGKSYNVAINATDYNFYGTTFGISGTDYWRPTDYMRTPYQVAKITAETRPGRIFCDSWYSTADESHTMMAAKLTHTLSPKTLYETSLEYLTRRYKTGPIAARDTSRIYEIVPGYFVDEAPFGWSSNPNTGITGMFFGGHTSTARDSTETSSLTLKFDLTSQVNFSNLVKTGFEFVYNNLDLDYGLVNPFFGDVNYVKEKDSPYRFSSYIQDKLEVREFILNVGLRMDYSNANTEWVVADPFDRNYFSSKYNPSAQYQTKKAEPDFSLSPRLAISHPITESSKLFFNYGHFKQLPTYEELLRVGRSISGGMRNYGNPNLALAKTVSYELGYDQVMLNTFLFQLALFYHDISDQQAYTQYTSADGSVSYYAANNNSYEDIRGFEITARKSAGRWWSGFVNYTYQVVTGGHFDRTQVYESASEQRIYDDNTKNLYQERPIPQPFTRANLMFNTPRDFGPKLAGLQPLGGWGANLLAEWKAGEYITWNPQARLNVAQNVQVKDWYDLTLRLNKTFYFHKVQLTCFAEINNLLNTRRLSGASFYDTDDFIFYMNSLHLPKSNYYDNLVGNDRVGEYRKPGVEFQPIEPMSAIQYEPVYELDDDENLILKTGMDTGDEGVIYYERDMERYVEYVAFTDPEDPNQPGEWKEIEKNRMKKILDDKAYIDMPNQSSFNFLNPRQVFFGITASFTLD